ncbi:MAG: acyl-CoA synthetase [Alphaproteobacteria bacterium]|nr:acyl-CoA synthetase [Alphaproteobacteria bacterium]
MAKPQARKQVGKPKKSGLGGMGILLWVLGLPAAFMFLPTIILLFFAMLPTFAALLAERGPNRFAWLCVGGMNFAGTSPYLLDLWVSGQSYGKVFEILGSVVTLMVMYGSSGFGWLLYSTLPPVVTVFMTLSASRRIARLRGVQRTLVDKWGPEVGRVDEEEAEGA